MQNLLSADKFMVVMVFKNIKLWRISNQEKAYTTASAKVHSLHGRRPTFKNTNPAKYQRPAFPYVM
jgi:hypothetical protein